MSRTSGLLAICLCTAVTTGPTAANFFQQAPATKDVPSEVTKKLAAGITPLAYFIGDWTWAERGGEGRWKCQWETKTFVLCRESYTNGREPATYLLSFDYDSDRYTFAILPAETGRMTVMPTRLEGKVWKVAIDGSEGGKTYHSRLELTMQDHDTLLRRSWWQEGGEGGKWVPSGDDTMKRIKK